MPQVFLQNFGQVDWEELYRENWEKLRAGMKAQQIDSLIVQNVINVRYLTGFYSMYPLYAMLNTCAAVFPVDAEAPTLFPIWYNEPYVKKRFRYLKDVRAIPVDMGEWPGAFGKLNLGKKIGVDSEMMYLLGKTLENKLGSKEIVVADDVLYGARSVKNPEELKVMEIATAIAEVGFDTAYETCVPGKREYEVAADIEYSMRRMGAEGPSHCLAISGENAALCAEIDTDKIIRNKETVIFDLGAYYEGYNAEWARTKFMGKPTEDQLEVFKLVYEAEQKAIQKVMPGVEACAVDKVARDILREGGWGPPHDHNYGTGHGIGVSVWEMPSIWTSKAKFKENNIVCVEPAVYKPGWGGVRIEDMVHVTSSGPKILSRTPYYYL